MRHMTTFLFVTMAAFLGNMAFGQEAAGIPEEIIAQLDSLVGTWEVEGKIGDKMQTGSYTCWWGRAADNKKACLVGRFAYKTSEAGRNGMNLIGWNSIKKCIEDRGFDANGGNATLYWTVKSPTEYQGEFLMVENGKETKSKGTLIKKGTSQIVMESESETGEVARFIFRRAKEERRQKARQ
jgi:hypothetical protein